MIFKKIGNMENVEAICHYLLLLVNFLFRTYSEAVTLESLRQLNRNFTELEVRLAFTLFIS